MGIPPAPVATIVQLAIETTGRSASLAVLCGDTVLASYYLDDRSRTAAALAPVLQQALAECERQRWELALISVADGPGSFTGLRIGITTAKTLAYARKLPIIGVDSVAAVAVTALLAAPTSVPIAQIRVALDAYRGQAFIGEFQPNELLPSLDAIPSTWTAHPSTVRVAEGAELDEFFAAAAPDTYFSGDAKALGDRVAPPSRVDSARINAGGTAPQSELGGPTPTVVDAVGVGKLAIRSFALGRTASPMELLPRYLRQSAAEEKAALKSDALKHTAARR